jgi:uncharacterized protein YbcC (UPF0753/DUF2309 family)
MKKTVDISIKTLIANAAKIIAPLWPLQTVIARNPLQGLESLPFEEALALGETFLAGGGETTASAVNRELVKWCQVFLDEGQATLSMPERDKGFYRAWALLAPFDRNLKASRNNDWLFSLPETAEEAVLFCLKRLAIPEDRIEEYLKYTLAEIPGWAGYIKWREEWQPREAGLKNPITLTDFLAVRLVITCALGEGKQKGEIAQPKRLNPEFFNALKKREEKYLLNLLDRLIPKLKKRQASPSRPTCQIVFCIDVRSEPLRLRMEQEGNYETFGFAGFFGLPVAIHSYNTDHMKTCCPVLLKPRHQVFEEPRPEESKRISQHERSRSLLKLCQGFYQDLKYNFATPFALVETLGVWCGLWMAIRTLMPLGSVKLKKALSLPLATFPKIAIPLEDQIHYAESALRIMGLTKNFSPLVVFCGHGSQTENNPYASALDCGACGGNPGGPNSKILAAILNSDGVRRALQKKGIAIPHDTLFIGAEHNTTTDEVLIDDQGLPSTHQRISERLKADFIKAGSATRQYRCHALGTAPQNVLKRSADWSETRPEWGLARNAAFIVGPRSLTKGLHLEGRCFLHSYAPDEDEDGKSLEVILTAPMVVAEWINTQYFFSTINNLAYGSGSKITQNVTGKFGIMQGNSSDLMHGLPLQSVNTTDDQSYHEPLRLQVLVYAPRSRLEALIERHPLLRTLFFNQWVLLVALDPTDSIPYRLTEKGAWMELATPLKPVRDLADFSCLR